MMRIVDALESLQTIASLSQKDTETALSYYGTVVTLLDILKKQQVKHNLGGTFNQKFREIRSNMEILAGLREEIGHSREQTALWMSGAASSLRLGSLFGAREELLYAELSEEEI